MLRGVDTVIWFSGATANGTGDTWQPRGRELFTVFIKAASVTVGATITIQAQTPAGDWTEVDVTNVTANGDTTIQFFGPFSKLRAVISSRTDGTYTVSAEAV